MLILIWCIIIWTCGVLTHWTLTVCYINQTIIVLTWSDQRLSGDNSHRQYAACSKITGPTDLIVEYNRWGIISISSLAVQSSRWLEQIGVLSMHFKKNCIYYYIRFRLIFILSVGWLIKFTLYCYIFSWKFASAHIEILFNILPAFF